MADEWEDESLMVVELVGAGDSKLLCTETIQVQMLGVASDKPVMMVNGCTFTGTYEDTVGTSLLIERKRNESNSQDGFEFFCKTDKKLVMQRAFVMEKSSSKDDDPLSKDVNQEKGPTSKEPERDSALTNTTIQER